MPHPKTVVPKIEAQTLSFRAPVAPIVSATWPVDEVLALFDTPFNDLIYRAQQAHRLYFDPGEVELATLLSIKTGGCEEDCAYCPQAARYHTGITAKKLMSTEQVLAAARTARANGATRFCMGTAWRGPKEHDMLAKLGLRTRAGGNPASLKNA